MKALFTICIAMLCLNAYAQDYGKDVRDYSPYGLDYPMLSFKMQTLSNHGYATQITYFDLNFVDQRMQNFLRTQLNMSFSGFPKFTKENGYQILNVGYVKDGAYIGNQKIRHLYFKYTLFENKSKRSMIKSLKIYGSAIDVIDFYVRYWPTTINFDQSKSKIAFNYLLQDKATIACSTKDGSWSISVENTTIHDTNEFYRELDKSSTSNVSLETAYSLKQKVEKDSMRKVMSRNIFYRDSLIKVANSYKLLKGEEKISTDTAWLKTVIYSFEKDLNAGKTYNQSNIDTLIQTLKEINPDPNKYITGNIVLKITPDGTIEDVKDQGFSTITPQLIDTIKQRIVGKKITPFGLNGKYYPSYKRYAVGFFPKVNHEYKFTEAGEIIEYNNGNSTTTN